MIEFLQNLPYKTYAGLFVCSLLAGYWLIPRIIWLARGLGIVGKEGVEGTGTPSAGGLAMGIPFVVGISLLMLLRNQVSDHMYMVPLQMRGLFFGASFALAAGFLDDLLILNRYVSHALRLATATIAFYYGFRFEVHLGPIQDFLIPVSFFMTALWVLGLTGLLNILAQRVRSFPFIAFAVVGVLLLFAFGHDQYRTIVVCSLLGGSLVSLLSYDSAARPALGKTGTLFLGYTLSVTTLQSGVAGGVSGGILVAAVTTAWIILALRLPTYFTAKPRPAFNDHSDFRRLSYLTQGLSIQLKSEPSPDRCWDLLCQAAQLFEFASMTLTTSESASFRTWRVSSGDPDELFVIPLSRSGGQLVLGEKPDRVGRLEPHRKTHFVRLAAVFDQRIERETIAQVADRKNEKRVLLINRFYAGAAATGQLVADLAEDLVRSGAGVTVLTGSLEYNQSRLVGGRNEMQGGVHVYRIPPTHFGRGSHFNRAVDYVFFYLLALRWIAVTPARQYTHVISFTDPPLVTALGYVSRRYKGWRHLYCIQDFYPQTAVALGVFKEGVISHLLDRVNKKLMLDADAVITLGKSMASKVAALTDGKRQARIIPNWADGRLLHPAPTCWKSAHSLPSIKDVYTVVYAGNMGLAQEMDVLASVVLALKDRGDLQFLFVGGGLRRNNLERIVNENQISNTHFVDYQTREKLNVYLWHGDRGIVTLSPKLKGLAVPTRTYTYLAVGMPLLIISAKGEEFDSLVAAGLGVHFEPRQLDEIVEFISEEARNGKREPSSFIREHFLKHMDRPRRTQEYINLLGEYNESRIAQT